MTNPLYTIIDKKGECVYDESVRTIAEQKARALSGQQGDSVLRAYHFQPGSDSIMLITTNYHRKTIEENGQRRRALEVAEKMEFGTIEKLSKSNVLTQKEKGLIALARNSRPPRVVSRA